MPRSYHLGHWPVPSQAPIFRNASHHDTGIRHAVNNQGDGRSFTPCPGNDARNEYGRLRLSAIDQIISGQWFIKTQRERFRRCRRRKRRCVGSHICRGDIRHLCSGNEGRCSIR